MTTEAKEYTGEQFVKLNDKPVKIGPVVKVSRTIKETQGQVTITIQAIIPRSELKEHKVDLSSLDALTRMLGDIFENSMPNISTSNIPTSPLDVKKVDGQA